MGRAIGMLRPLARLAAPVLVGRTSTSSRSHSVRAERRSGEFLTGGVEWVVQKEIQRASCGWKRVASTPSGHPPSRHGLIRSVMLTEHSSTRHRPPGRPSAGVGLLEACADVSRQHEHHSTSEHRRGRGQVFTALEVARFMAGLLPETPSKLRLLDPGAGTGILTAAICERMAKLQTPRHLEVHLYENDAAVLPLLQENVALCREYLLEAGHSAEFTIHDEDFVLANEPASDQGEFFTRARPSAKFDAVITNPPYFKIAGDSRHAAIFRALVHGQPNIYALFLAIAAEKLRPGGALVAITPRSFCNGLYFRGFRHWFFERMTLRHAHLFESRRDAFREAGVLQESLITMTTRLGAPARQITISTSYGRDDLTSPRRLELSADHVIDDSCGDMVIRLPSDDIDARIMAIVESWPLRFADHGLRVSTGPVVSFRAREYLVQGPREPDTVPLLLVHNVRRFRTEWPLLANGKPAAFRVAPGSEKMLVPALNYVLIRRFSAKEERRRLTASCFLRRTFQSRRVAIENHLNYVYHAERELTEDETFGLAGLFNSVLLDRYFRMLSGNTQVNATEIRTLNFPELAVIRAIGRCTRRLAEVNLVARERVVLEALGVKGSLGTRLLEAAGE